MDEAQIVAHRMRVHLLADIEHVALADEPGALDDTELGRDLELFAEGGHASLAALTTEEADAAKQLADEMVKLWDHARANRRRIEPADLVSFGWFERVRPLAQSAFAIFMARGRLDRGLW